MIVSPLMRPLNSWRSVFPPAPAVRIKRISSPRILPCSSRPGLPSAEPAPSSTWKVWESTISESVAAAPAAARHLQVPAALAGTIQR